MKSVTFMAPDLPESRPPLGQLKVGDEVLIVRSKYGRGSSEPTPARVDKIGRVWVYLNPSDWGSQTRFRMDDQVEGREIGSPDRFYTPEQYRFVRALNDARAFLREQEINLNYASKWSTDPSRTILLARTVWLLLEAEEEKGLTTSP